MMTHTPAHWVPVVPSQHLEFFRLPQDESKWSEAWKEFEEEGKIFNDFLTAYGKLSLKWFSCTEQPCQCFGHYDPGWDSRVKGYGWKKWIGKVQELGHPYDVLPCMSHGH